MADIDNCDGSNYLRRVCDGGGGGGGGGSAFNDTLSNGDGIANLSYDGSSSASVSVNSTVVRNTSNQTILGGLTANYLRSHGPITGQGLNISGVFVVEADGSVGGTSPSATQVIAWDGSQWAPADGGGGATSSNLDNGYILNQSLRTSDSATFEDLDLTLNPISLTTSGSVGIATSTPKGTMGVSGSVYAQSLFITGADGLWGQVLTGGGGASVTATNLGAGSGIVSGVVSNDIKVKSLVGGTNLQITGDAESLYLNVTGISGADGSGIGSATNVGVGSGLISGVSDDDIKVKSLFGGTNLQITGDDQTLFLNVTGLSDANISFSTNLTSGASEYLITYPSSLDSAPQVSVTVENSGNGGIMPYAISGVTESNYTVIFSQLIPDNNYSIHTILGGGSDILSGRWSTGSSNSIYYDQGNVGIGTSNPTRPLQVDSTAGGVLLPRLTNAQESASTPSNGEIIYNTSTNKFRGYENGSWVDLV